jgi:hypothetical protein
MSGSDANQFTSEPRSSVGSAQDVQSKTSGPSASRHEPSATCGLGQLSQGTKAVDDTEKRV